MAVQGRGVVVPGNHEHRSAVADQPGERLRDGGLLLGARLGAVEQVSGDEDRVDVIGLRGLGQLPERLEQPPPARVRGVPEGRHGGAEVDVGEMQESDHDGCPG